MEIQLNRWDFWSHSNAIQAFVRIIKQHPQLHIEEAEIETALYNQTIHGEICADEYNLCVALIGVMEGEYGKSWRPGTTIEFNAERFNKQPFEYQLDIASRSNVIDDKPDTTGIFLILRSPEMTIRLRIVFLHQIFDEVVSWLASLPVKLVAANHRGNSFPVVQKAYDRLKEILEK